MTHTKYFKEKRLFSPINCLFILLGIVVIFFSDVLFFSTEKVLSAAGKDLYYEFVYFREFGFQQIRQGNIALWNPHIFSGTPFLGGFHSALLYPLNSLFLIFPLQKALNISFVLHVFLSGAFMFWWLLTRGLKPIACLIASILFIFSGAYFLHIYAGHLPHICTMTWVPLVLLSIEGLRTDRYVAWGLLGIFAVTMQILAGFPQHVFYTAITVGIYSCLLMIQSKHKARICLGLVSIYASAALLSAIQLFPGFLTAEESVRGSGLSYKFASFFNFPPENLITLLAPKFFGDMIHLKYWGHYYLWEMSVFIGVIGFALSLYALTSGENKIRQYSCIMFFVLMILAFGSKTPVFNVLFTYMPGFNLFRGSSKFIFYAVIFLIMLTGIGMDQVLNKTRAPTRKIFIVLFSMSAGLVVLSSAIWISSQYGDTKGVWAGLLRFMHTNGSRYISEPIIIRQEFIRFSGIVASVNLLSAAGLLFLGGGILFCQKKYPPFSTSAGYVIAILAVAEILFFAKGFYSTFNISFIQSPGIEQISASDKHHYRMLNEYKPNSAMIQGTRDIWGYDAIVLRRYAEFMNYTQDKDPDNASMYLAFSNDHRFFKMLQCRFIYTINKGNIIIKDLGETMPRALLVGSYSVLKNRDEIFSKMSEQTFDPRQLVILESNPSITPVASEQPGTVSVKNISTDQIVISANLKHPAILLVTENFSKGWRVLPLSQTNQKSYSVMPANYIYQAIPLKQGTHQLLLEYLPLHYRIGKWVSICALSIYLLFSIWYFCKPFRKQITHQN